MAALDPGDQPLVGAGGGVALADRVVEPVAHDVERGRELAALLDRLQDRRLLPADLLHGDLEALLRRAGLGGVLVALARRAHSAGPGRPPRCTTAGAGPRWALITVVATVAEATAIQPMARSAAVPETSCESGLSRM